jgi:hypothetical protein
VHASSVVSEKQVFCFCTVSSYRIMPRASAFQLSFFKRCAGGRGDPETDLSRVTEAEWGHPWQWRLLPSSTGTCCVIRVPELLVEAVPDTH